MRSAALKTAARETSGAARNLEDLVGYRLRRVGALVIKELGGIFGAVGLAPGQFSILMLIGAHPHSSQSDLALLAGVDRSTLVPVIERLLTLGYITRLQNESDRRAYRLQISTAGRRAVEKATPLAESFERRVTKGFAADDKRRLLIALQQIEESLTSAG